MNTNQSGQSTVEFLMMASIIAAMAIVGIQMGALLVKSEHVSFAAFLGARASCVGGDGAKQVTRCLGTNQLTRDVQCETANGLAEVKYSFEKGAVPLLESWLGEGRGATVHGRCMLFPDPGGDDGDN